MGAPAPSQPHQRCAHSPKLAADVVAVPALLSALFHASWIAILLIWAGATGSWPGRCASSDGVQYVVLFLGFLITFGANMFIDGLLVYHSLQGGPFEASRRRWVAPLLYAATVPLVATLGFTGRLRGRAVQLMGGLHGA